MNILEFLGNVSSMVWGLPLILLLVGAGVWLTFLLRGLQFTHLWHGLYLGLIQRSEEGDGDISHFQALMTALSATVGTGNIAGVATAIAAGGPGALFWMWVTGLIGMATKYAEALLAVKYRIVDQNGEMAGGPMYYIRDGLGWKKTASLFALFASVAAFGIGNMVQSNSVADALEGSFGVSTWVSGVLLMAGAGMVVLGGIRSIARVASTMVPLMIVLYIGASLIILFLKASLIPQALGMVFSYAFTPHAQAGGFLGATVMLTIRMGVARGVFSNESGLGSSPIAAAAAKTTEPGAQALVSMTQTFIDTLVVCTMTGLVLIVSGEWNSGLTAAQLTASAFASVISHGDTIVSICLAFFAFSTILGWCYYGERSIEYLLGEKAIRPYRVVFTLFVGVGAISHLKLVWTVSDIFNGLMAFPNLLALLVLSPVIANESKKYLGKKST